MKISIILPVYNEAEGIVDFHTVLKDELDKLKNQHTFEILYVVDKCKDGSLEILQGIASTSKNVIVLGLSRRFGHQMSLVAGLDHCTGDAAVMMDCDLEHPPSLIPELIKAFENGSDIVRTRRIYSQKVSWSKRLSSRLYYRLLNFLTGENFGEGDADFRLVSRRVITLFKKNVREHNQYLRGLFRWVGYPQSEITFTAEFRQKGKSKYNLVRLFELGLQGIISFSKVPLLFSIILGILVALAGLVYACVIVFQRIFNAEFAPSGWTTLIIFILLIGGVQLVVLGFIGEYIAAIFDEVKNRPLYIIESINEKKV